MNVGKAGPQHLRPNLGRRIKAAPVHGFGIFPQADVVELVDIQDLKS